MSKSVVIDLREKPSSVGDIGSILGGSAASRLIVKPWSESGLLKLLLDWIKDVLSPGEAKPSDIDFINRVIKQGEESDVDEMTIKVNKEQLNGFERESSLGQRDGGKGYNITLGNKGESDYEIHVDYKS